MKQLFFLLLVCHLDVFSEVSAQRIEIFQVENADLKSCIRKVEQLTGNGFLYNGRELEQVKGISLHLQNVELTEVLERLLEGTGYGYELVNGVIAIRKSPVSELLPAVKRVIRGTVKDKSGSTLPGVSVLIKGTQSGVATDVNGRFEISVGDNAETILQFSFVGMKTKEVKVGNSEVMNVELEPAAENLDEVVVTGYQTISKERATGSFAKVSAEALETRRLDNLSSVLEGRIAGYSDGIIRGVSTMNAMKTPLYVIDGFPVENTTIDGYGRVTENMPDLNMEDIETITILKDAAAASIYGARAANGVVVITTQKAREGKTQVSASATWTVQPYSYYRGHMTDAADLINLEKYWAARNPELNNGIERAQGEADELRNNSSALPGAGTEILLDWKTGKISEDEANRKLDELALRGNCFYKDVMKYAKRNRFYQQYNLTIGKASGRNNFNLSLSYRNNKEEDIYTKNDWAGINFSNTLQITSWLKADMGAYINYKNGTEQTYDLFSEYSSGFIARPYDLLKENGDPVTIAAQQTKTVRDNIANYGLYSMDISPLDELGLRLNKTREFGSRMFGKLDIKLFPWLSYSTMFQYEYSVKRLHRLEEQESVKVREMINKFATLRDGEVVYNLPAGDIYYSSDHFSNAYNYRQQLNFDKIFHELHNLTWIIGQDIRNTKLEYSSLTRYGYNSEMLSSQYIDETLLTAGFSGLMNRWASLDPPYRQRELVNRFVSFYSNIAYSFDNRYTFSGSIRWDRSNLWGTNSEYQNKPLWSMGVNWNITREHFFNMDRVNLLKLRASYGIGGNIAKDAAPYLTANYYTSSLVDGLYGHISSPPNPDLRWEKTKTLNIGFDFAFFAGRLSGSLDYYNKKSVDLLANQMGVPTEGFGYSTLAFNNGAMRNRGIELSLAGDIISKSGFTWNAGFLFAYNKNEVTKSKATAPVYYLQLDYPESYPSEGKPYNSIWAYRWAGLDKNGEPQIYDKNAEVTTTDYTDLEAIHYVGTSVPVYNGSFTNRLVYKHFEWSVMLLYAGGHKIRNTNIPKINMGNMAEITAKDITKCWQNPGDERITDVPRLLFSNMEGYNYDRESIYRGADIHVLNASYLKISNMSLAYRLPSKLVKKARLGSARLQFNIENLATIAFDKKVGYLLGTKVKPNYVCGLYLSF